MQRRLSRLLALLSALTILFSAALAQPRYPQKLNRIQDSAAVLSKDTVDDLTTLCRELSEEDTLELYVATVDFLDGYTMTDYADGLRNFWKLDEDALLLVLCVGEDRYAFSGGRDVNDKLSPAVQRKLLASFLDKPFMAQQYDAAIASLVPALVREINKAYDTSVDVVGLFGVSAQLPAAQGWLARLMHDEDDPEDAPAFHITDEHIDTGLSLGKVILIVVLLLIIFGNHGSSRRHDRRGCGCSPLSGLLAALGLWRLWKDD